MSYETKVILKAVLIILKTSKTLEDGIKKVAEIAAVEGVSIPELSEEQGDEA